VRHLPPKLYWSTRLLKRLSFTLSPFDLSLAQMMTEAMLAKAVFMQREKIQANLKQQSVLLATLDLLIMLNFPIISSLLLWFLLSSSFNTSLLVVSARIQS
jgi:hypothetical protein